MKCPFCHFVESKVVDSRDVQGGDEIRRRRECIQCGRRFTTYEKIETVLPTVVKRDGRREPFLRDKVMSSLSKASAKRSISTAHLNQIVDDCEKHFQSFGDREIPSKEIGYYLMNRLKVVDEVAYVRFASVYRQFKDISEFVQGLDV